jgi:hypothetical protein
LRGLGPLPPRPSAVRKRGRRRVERGRRRVERWRRRLSGWSTSSTEMSPSLR